MKIYFSGIGGMGIGPLAQIARDAGHTVLGSDQAPSLMTDKLIAEGITVHIGPQDGQFLRDNHAKAAIDWFVFTAAAKPDHPELLLASELGIHAAKRDELLAEIIDQKGLQMIAVSGTHGKTTTTGMFVWAMQQLGVPVSYSIGTTLSFGDSGHYEAGSQYFVYECDEFDRNMLHFHPHLSIIPSLDYDHADTYPTQTDYLMAFRQFAEQSQRLITWSDQHAETYDGLTNITLLDKSSVDNDLKLAGLHNRLNATLVQAALKELDVAGDSTAALSSFPGIDRRFEKLADNLYSDYAHHPAEIVATLQLARELSDHVVVVYQPHQNIRQHSLKDVYKDQFEAAEAVYWLPTYLSREDPDLPVLTPEDLIQNLTNKDHVTPVEFDDALWQKIEAARQAGKLVVCMGAGAIDGWVRDRLKN